MKKKLVRKFISIILALSLLTLGLTGCGSSPAPAGDGAIDTSKVYNWKIVTHQMVGTSRYATVVKFCELVKKDSGGRLNIEPYGAGVLFPVTDTLNNVKNGVVQLSACWDGYWAGIDPVFALAGNIPSDPIKTFSEHFYRSEKLEGVMKEAYKNYGITYIGAFDYGPPEILMSNKKIEKIDDFKGLNIRTAGISAAFYKNLGASPVSLGSTEVYTALQLGTVDAAEYNDWLVNEEMGLQEVTKYVIEPAMHQSSINDKSLIANSKAWAELPEDLKAIVNTAMLAVRYESAVAIDVGSKLSKDRWIKAGVQIINLPDSEVEKGRVIGVNLLKEYAAKNTYCKKYIDIYVQVLKDLGYGDFAAKLQ